MDINEELQWILNTSLWYIFLLYFIKSSPPIICSSKIKIEKIKIHLMFNLIYSYFENY